MSASIADTSPIAKISLIGTWIETVLYGKSRPLPSQHGISR